MALFYVDWDVLGGATGTPQEKQSRNARTRDLLTRAVQAQGQHRFEKLGSTTLLWQAPASAPSVAKLRRAIEAAFTQGCEPDQAYDRYKLIVARVGRAFEHAGFTAAEQTQLEAVRAREPQP